MPIDLTIVTPQGEAFHGPVETVVLPGTEGDFGVLEHHERFLSPLRIGELDIESAGAAPRYAAVSDGFAEVSAERVVVMVSTCEFSDQIDEARAERARVRAEAEVERLREDREESNRFRLEEAALQRAVIRLQVSKKR
ncbi:MAG: ATP synthase F1 subunit epsilon [Myxococcota bacterium]|nr:ATP synthase F1 subunit epsilon [Myxococcota bacterium]